MTHTYYTVIVFWKGRGISDIIDGYFINWKKESRPDTTPDGLFPLCFPVFRFRLPLLS
jgi:hypothetical protein